MTQSPCPTPDKQTYLSREAAAKSRGRKNKGNRMTAYRCVCGCWHLRRRET